MTSTDPGLRRLALSALVPGFAGTDVPGWLGDALADGLAGVCLFGQNCESPEQVRTLSEQMRAIRPGVVVMADEEGGTVSRLDGGLGSPWPAAAALGALDDVEATYAVGQAIGRRAASAGIDLVIAPVLDVNSEPDNPVIGVRSFGADPGLVARHGRAFARGLADAGVLACGKHFPGHGATRTDSHVGLPVLDLAEERWRATDLPPFAAAVQAGIPTLMTAHVVLRCLDDQPATVSARVLGVLRHELGFEGAIVSDALDMKAIAAGMGRPAGAVRALAAGVDLVCIGNPVFPDVYDDAAAVEEICGAIVAAVRRDELPVARLEDSAARIAALPRGRAVSARPAPRPRSELVAAGAGIAARALTVRGDVRLGRGATVLVPARGVGYAAGRTSSALVEELRRRRPGWRVVDVEDAEAAVAQARAATGDLVVVLEGSDPHRHHPLVGAVLEVAPAAVVVHGGLRRDDDPGERTVHTHGTSAGTAVAVADLLLGDVP